MYGLSGGAVVDGVESWDVGGVESATSRRGGKREQWRVRESDARHAEESPERVRVLQASSSDERDLGRNEEAKER